MDAQNGRSLPSGPSTTGLSRWPPNWLHKPDRPVRQKWPHSRDAPQKRGHLGRFRNASNQPRPPKMYSRIMAPPHWVPFACRCTGASQISIGISHRRETQGCCFPYNHAHQEHVQHLAAIRLGRGKIPCVLFLPGQKVDPRSRHLRPCSEPGDQCHKRCNQPNLQVGNRQTSSSVHRSAIYSR